MTSKGEEVFRVTTMSWNETVVGWLGLRNSANLLKALECMLEVGGSVWDGNYTPREQAQPETSAAPFKSLPPATDTSPAPLGIALQLPGKQDEERKPCSLLSL